MFFSESAPVPVGTFDRDELLLMSDDKLADLCSIDAFVGKGPGGQHRNRNYTAIRVVLKCAENISAEETAFRSQKQNLQSALNKLRYKIAVTFRKTVPQAAAYTHLNSGSQLYAFELAKIIDVVSACRCDHKEAAAVLNMSNTKLLKELARDYQVWEAFIADRKTLGLKPLERPGK